MITQHGDGIAAGEFGPWLWAEHRAPGLACGDVVRALSRFFLRCRGVCASWDSGKLHPLPVDLASWQLRGEHAVSPVVDGALADAWPRSSCGFDEWYFVREVPNELMLHALCNWGASVAEASGLRNVPSGFDFLAQLERYHPYAVLGDGHRTFLVTQDSALLEAFMGESRRRRTRG